MTTLFITGASGFIGGEFLHALVNAHPEYRIRALVRDPTKAKLITAAYKDVEVVDGGLDNVQTLEEEVARADVVLHLAAAGNWKSAKLIHDALKSRTDTHKPVYWIQMSGVTALVGSELADKSRIPGSPSDVVFDDLSGIDDIRTNILNHPDRVVENLVLLTGSTTAHINTALVFPPMVYGKGQGPVNQRSIQIPELAKATLKRGRGLQVGKGLNRWGNAHVYDVGQLLLRLTERAVEARSGDEKLWNDHGLYLTSVGEEAFANISKDVIAAAVQKGYIASGEGVVDELLGDEADTLLPYGRMAYGTNARCTSRRASELLGWTPKYTLGLEDEITRVVDVEAKALGLPS